jgi:hypothetical protein
MDEQVKKSFDKVVDSGKRQEFNTGSVRDTAEGKGTPHLIAGEALEVVYKNLVGIVVLAPVSWFDVYARMLKYSEIVENKEKNIQEIYAAILMTITMIGKGEDNSYSSALTRLARHYENGAKKYAKNNWRKGQPISRYYDSACRHIWKAIDGLKDEDHEAAIFWNLLAIVQTKIDIEKGLLPKELNDFPFIISETFSKKEEVK